MVNGLIAAASFTMSKTFKTLRGRTVTVPASIAPIMGKLRKLRDLRRQAVKLEASLHSHLEAVSRAATAAKSAEDLSAVAEVLSGAGSDRIARRFFQASFEVEGA
jgi:hypothetical protein